MEKLRQVRSQFAQSYELLRWIIYVFLGGSLNALILEAFIKYLLIVSPFLSSFPYPPPTEVTSALVTTVILAILVFFAPVVISISLTRLKPEKQIVPPLYIQIVTYAWILGFSYTLPPSTILYVVTVGAYYVLFGGVIQDRIATSIVGRFARKKDMISFSLRISANIEKVRDILLIEKFRKNLNLGKKVESDNGCLTIRSQKKGKFTTILRMEKGSTEDETILSEVFFEIKDYYITLPDDLEIYARFRFENLKTIFSKEYKIETADLPDTYAEPLINLVLGEMQGWTLYTEKLSKMDWLKIVAFLSAIVFSAYLFIADYFASAIATLIIVLLYLAFELPSRLRRRGD